jgi:molybdopterin/thiamine biosynthesis adenylyltransferase
MSFYLQRFMRNTLSKSEQAFVRRAHFAIVGLGGTGGFVLENLLRLGAEGLVVFEDDRFELSNFNRQALATEEFLDQPKIHAAIARAKSINPDADIEARGLFEEGSSLKGVDIVIDGSDNVETKLAVSESARALKIPYVFCSAQSTRGIISVFTDYRFEKAFHLPKKREALERYASCPDILCPAASLAGTIAASQALNVPQALFFDLFRKDIFWRARLG